MIHSRLSSHTLSTKYSDFNISDILNLLIITDCPSLFSAIKTISENLSVSASHPSISPKLSKIGISVLSVPCSFGILQEIAYGGITSETPDQPNTPDEPDTPDKPKKDRDHDDPVVVTVKEDPVEVVVIEEPTVPLAAADLVTLEDPAVPLAVLPMTGDMSSLWMVIAALSGLSLTGLTISDKKKKRS